MADDRTHLDEETVQRQHKQMFKSENGHDHGLGNVMSQVDLNAPDDEGIRGTDITYDDMESPFKAPAVAVANDLSQSSTGHTAYPRPAPVPPPISKVEQVTSQVKDFTVETFKTTKQFLSEILGKSSRTTDPQLETPIAELKTLQAAYIRLINQAKTLHGHLSNVVLSQKQMTDIFGELSLREPKLVDDFNCNAEAQKVIVRNGEQLLKALDFFITNMKTLCYKTIQDCLDTVKKYESARLQYDTYRSEHEQVIHSGASASIKTAEVHEKYEDKRRKYEQLKADVAVKLQFLDENKHKVVHRQMVLFHNATAAYFSGNQQQLDSVMNQFSISIKSPNSEPSSWLESDTRLDH